MENKFKIGDNIKIPTKKTYSIPLEECSAIVTAKKNKQDYLFITSAHKDHYTVGVTVTRPQSDFNEGDLELYEEPKEESIVYTKEYLEANDILVAVSTKEEYDTLVGLGIHLNRIIPYSVASNYIAVEGSIEFYIKSGTYCSPNYYRTNLPYSGFPSITAQEVINSHKQESMKAQTFTINGKPKLLEAFAEELVSLGYNIDECVCPLPKAAHISNNHLEFKVISQYKKLYTGRFTHMPKVDKVFEIPKQYEEALEFVKEQLGEKYWKKEEKKRVIEVGSNNFKITVSGKKIICSEGILLIDEIQSLVSRLTPILPRINTYNVAINSTVRFIRIGCFTENHLFSLEDLNLVLNTYKEVNG